jgi:hypothetical protein
VYGYKDQEKQLSTDFTDYTDYTDKKYSLKLVNKPESFKPARSLRQPK